MEGRPAAWRFSASTSKTPDGSCAMMAFGMPFSRIRAVSARVSMPVESDDAAGLQPRVEMAARRQLDGSVTAVCRMTPRTPEDAAMLMVSTSSSLTPTLPICGKVKVTIWPA